jgi:hypothetical protein
MPPDYQADWRTERPVSSGARAHIGSDWRSVELNMDEVTLVNLEVVRFPISCETRSTQLRGCSPYIHEWIRREQESDHRPIARHQQKMNRGPCLLSGWI